MTVSQENGPCTFNGNTSEPVLNPYSWNEYANLLYVDEPIGTGFSYGNDTVDGTIAAAPLVWILLQAFFANFPRYRGREFGLFTESYGGHYGPGESDEAHEGSVLTIVRICLLFRISKSSDHRRARQRSNNRPCSSWYQ